MKSRVLHKIVGLNSKMKPSGTIRRFTKSAVLAILIAAAFGALPPAFTGVQASSCGDPSVFAFPPTAKQGDLVTFFVTVGNSTGTDQSFVVESEAFDPTNTPVFLVDRVVSVPAGSDFNFQFGLITDARNRPGTYTIVTRTYPGTSLPACENCFCSTTQGQFTLECNSNGC